MKLLALETATEACSVALWDAGAVLERYQIAPRRHAALLLPMASELLAEAGWTMAQLDAIAVGRGPGAFTGVRIAISVAQGLAFAADLPIAPISTLAALAIGATRDTAHARIATALDARMGEVYWAGWDVGGATIVELCSEQVCAPDSVAAPPSDWFGIGSAWLTYPEILAERLGTQHWQGERYPHAADVARLAAQPEQRHHWVSPERACPVYLRDRVV